MNIGVDLDNTILLTDESILNDINKYCKGSFTPKDLKLSSLEESLGVERKLASIFVEITLNLTHLIKPFNGIPYYFNKISNTNNVSIISRRDPSLYGVTKMALDKLGLRDYLLFLTLGKKSDIIKASNIELMIDDSLEELNDVYANTKCNMFLMSRYWNKNFVETGNIKRVKTWEEIYATITSIQARELSS